MVKKREQKKAEKVKAKNKEILKECDIETTPLRLNFLRFVGIPGFPQIVLGFLKISYDVMKILIGISYNLT